MEDTDFPEYGRQCELKEPWRGYHRGTITGRNGYRFIIELGSGARIELYVQITDTTTGGSLKWLPPLLPGRQTKRSDLPCNLRNWLCLLVHT